MKGIILSGGSGTRLWPLSTQKSPKQFAKIFDGKSLLQLTAKRLSLFCDELIIVSNIRYSQIINEQLAGFNFKVILEPIGRNTAPAIALACFDLNKNETVIVCPSDHFIDDKPFVLDVSKAEKLTEEKALVTFGIKPHYPETGFGYIMAEGDRVLQFQEKPNLQTAINYVESGNYFWNAGIFCFKVSDLLEELNTYRPNLFVQVKTAYEKRAFLENGFAINLDDMKAIDSESIDYAVMENSKNVSIVRADFDWTDLGSFDALSEFENIGIPHQEIDSKDNFVYSDTELNVSIIGLENIIVVKHENNLLICKKGESQKVKNAAAYFDNK